MDPEMCCPALVRARRVADYLFLRHQDLLGSSERLNCLVAGFGPCSDCQDLTISRLVPVTTNAIIVADVQDSEWLPCVHA